MDNIYQLFENNKKLQKILKVNKVINCSNNETLAFYVAYKYQNEGKPLVLVMENLYQCQIMYNILSSMKDNVYMYSVDEVSKLSSLASSCELASQRIYVLNKLLNHDSMIVVTHTLAIKRITPSKRLFKEKTFSLNKNQNINILELIRKLIELGYKNVYQVTQPFEYSTRGGVVDVFPIDYDKPIRIEFFDDIIDEIRFFDTDRQRTIQKVDNVHIIPATEFLVDNMDNGIEKIKQFALPLLNMSSYRIELENMLDEDINKILSYDFDESLYKYYSFFDNFDSFASYLEFCDVLVCNENKVIDNEIFIENEFFESQEEYYNQGEDLKGYHLLNRYIDFKNEIKNVSFASTDIENKVIDLNFKKVDTFDYNNELLYKELVNLLSRHYTIYIGLSIKVQYDALVSLLNQKELSYNEVDVEGIIKKDTINISSKDYNIGLDFEEYKIYVIGEKEIYKKRFSNKISQFSRYKNAITIESVNDLELGDYLVHDIHGIGIYKGIETLLINGVHRDYIKIEYKDNAFYFVPLEQFNLVRKYVSHEGAKPKINKLGSKEWEHTKEKVTQRVTELADKLVSLYSNRAKKPGFAFLPDDDLQESFERDFPYELTKDQTQVLKEIKDDMEKGIIMDRLLVGDVGFGKTEIAMRAAFKAINSGKQVALLCPTTLLARQHYLTALDRFKNFGVNIALLSRKVSEKEINRILEDVKNGKVEFVIGTHRLLSDDVSFKNIGLLIVDEEHKFGVEHKEKIKILKENIDVLTLSATPIPRTLQMALTGVRGFSTINTPISNRMPVQTYVVRKDKKIIKEVIERELARNGQVYYLYNRIDRLSTIAHEIKELVKDAKIAIAHGKLSVEATEDIMQQFIAGEYNILLCTTIIENGIDIPNVNTIIVENADCFGLSQLYQIKGRVGRSDRLAYAYLMYSPNKELSEIATKRLKTIREFTALGSGYKVAMRDLITRGAGDILGAEQSGFIETVGIDMYIEMLQAAIEERKLQEQGIILAKKDKYIKPEKVLNVDAYIPDNYFNNDFEKIELYKEIEKVDSIEKLLLLHSEVVDKTGKIPESIELLFEKRGIDLYKDIGIIEGYDEYNDRLSLYISGKVAKYRGIGIPIFDMACKLSRDITMKFQVDKIFVNISKKANWLHLAYQFVSKLSIIVKEYENKHGH